MSIPDERIRRAVEMVADESGAAAALIDTGDDYRIIWANRQLKDFLKTASVAPEGMRWGGRCPFAFGINAVRVMQEVIRTGKPVRVEEQTFGTRISTRFGETTYWNWKILPCPSDDCPGCVLVMAENVTDHVARKALEQGRKPEFGGVVLDLPVGVATIDPKDYTILDANDIWLSYLPPECQSRASIGRTLFECVPQFAQSELEPVIRRVVSTREVFSARELELKDPVRGPIWWSITLRFVDVGEGREALLMTAWEVSEQVNARHRVEIARARAQALLKVQSAISSSLSLDLVLELITDSVRDLLGAKAASVLMLSDDGSVLAPVCGSGMSVQSACAIVLDSHASLAARALRERRPVTLIGPEAAKLECLTGILGGEPILSVAAAPIEAENEVIGVVEAYNTEQRRFTNDEIETLDSLAAGAATAIVNARLFQSVTDARQELQAALAREQKIAQTLQKALMSEVPAYLSGFHLAAIYEAGLREAEIGGDFFDIFSPKEGIVAVVIGDVAGKGLGAAIQIASAKYGIRSYAYEDPAPSHVVAMMNEAMYRESPAGGFITLFYGVIDVRTQEMVFANGGHEPPLLRKADGRVIRLLSDGIVLGVSPGIAYQEGTATIEKGDRLLLYTDGITEARKEAGDMLGEDRLREYWSKCCDIDAATALDRVYHWAREFSEGHFHDDVAMVVIAREE